MTETALSFSKETGKPNPVSYREYALMDRHEQRVFVSKLSRGEKKDFQLAVVKTLISLPLDERRELSKALVKKLEKRDNFTIPDKIELTLEKLRLAQLMLPKKEPILFRKFRKNVQPPKYIREAKSPYLISP